MVTALCLFLSILNTTNKELPKKDTIPNTEIIVIGTIHSPTLNYSAEALLDILKKVNPQVILYECDSSAFPDSFQLLGFWRKGQEGMAVVEFQSVSPGCVLRPYDIEGRDKFYKKHNYFKLEKDVLEKINQAYNDGKTNGNVQLYYGLSAVLMDIKGSFSQESPRVINSGAYDYLVSSEKHYVNEGFKTIIDSIPELHQYKDFWKLDCDFWIKRNDTMVNNIIHFSKEFSGKRIVVMCGCEHRYYLVGKLKEKQKDNNFALREYWELE
ncbi:MAG: hypothetical protein WC614_05235 [bacterium]